MKWVSRYSYTGVGCSLGCFMDGWLKFGRKFVIGDGFLI